MSGQELRLAGRDGRAGRRALRRRVAGSLALVALAAIGAAPAWAGTRGSVPAARGGGLPVSSIVPLAAEWESFQEAFQVIGGDGLFGASVALSADGRTAVIGEPAEGGGAAFVYGRTSAGWQEQAQLIAGEPGGEPAPCGEGEEEECRLGISVAISASGDTALVGSPREEGRKGSVRTFLRSGGAWFQLGPKLTGGGLRGKAQFGRSVAISADGETALVGAPGASSAVAFHRSGSAWVQEGATLAGSLSASTGRFGRTVALSGDGRRALVGAPGVAAGDGRVWAYDDEGGEWTLRQELSGGAEETAGGHFGLGLAISLDGGTAVVGASASGEQGGTAFVLVDTGEDWVQQARLSGPVAVGAAGFGQSISLSADGAEALIGGPADSFDEGAAWIFTRTGSQWSAQVKLLPPESPLDSRFGTAVALSGDALTALVGAPADVRTAGSVWVLSTPPAPTVSSVEPATGPSAGGTRVRINGTGFLPGAGVRIGSLAASAEVVSESEIEAVTAKTPAGRYEVQVTDAGGTSSGGPPFTFTPPPAEGTPPPAEGTAGPPAGTSIVPRNEVLPERSAVPAPELGVSGNLAPVSGHVRVRLPHTGGFEELTTIKQVPFGTLVDASQGSVSVTTAGGPGGTQTMSFYLGEFVLTQGRNGQATATLAGGSERACRRRAWRGRPADVSSSKHPVRKLWASGHGHYSTSGHYAAGAVLGTRWLTEDLCGETLIRVATDAVAVTDFVRHRHILVRAGHTYVARAR